MNDADLKHLLGGYATNTLTPGERDRLFAAALEDQELFNALADEQALKEMLDDPESRGYLKEALAETPALTQERPPVTTRAFAAAAAPLSQAPPPPSPPPPPPSNSRFYAALTALFVTASASVWYIYLRPSVAEPKREQQPQTVAVATPPPTPPPSSPPAAAPARAPSPAPASQPAERRRVAAPVPEPVKVAEAEAKGVVGSSAGLAAAVDYTLRRRNASGEFVALPPGAKLAEGDEIEIVLAPAAASSFNSATAVRDEAVRKETAAKRAAPAPAMAAAPPPPSPSNRFTLKAGENVFTVSGRLIRIEAAPKNP